MIDVCKYGFPMQVLSSDKFDLHSTVYLACFTEKKWIKLCVFQCFGKTSKRETIHWWLKHFNRIWSTGGAHIKVCHVPKFWAPSWFLQKSVIKNVVHFPSSELSQNQHASPLFWAPSWFLQKSVIKECSTLSIQWTILKSACFTFVLSSKLTFASMSPSFMKLVLLLPNSRFMAIASSYHYRLDVSCTVLVCLGVCNKTALLKYTFSTS